MENYQADLITLPSKKVEYIAQGFQGLAQGIAQGMTTYAATIQKNKEEKAKRDQDMLKTQSIIDSEYNAMIMSATDKIYEKGGDAIAFQNNARAAAELAKKAKFETMTNASLTADEKKLYDTQMTEFFDYIGNSKGYAANEEAIIQSDAEKYKDAQFGTDFTITSVGPYDSATAEGRRKNETENQILQNIRQGKQAAIKGYTITKTNENRTGRSVTIVQIKNDETGEVSNRELTVDNLSSYYVEIPKLEVAKTLEKLEVRPKNGTGFNDDFLMGSLFTENPEQLAEYKSITELGVVDTVKIDRLLKDEVRSDVAAQISIGGGQLIEYIENLGFSPEEVDRLLSPEMAGKELLEILYEQESAAQKEKYTNSLNKSVATPQEIAMAEAAGAELEVNEKGEKIIYTLRGKTTLKSDPTSTASQKRTSQDNSLVIGAMAEFKDANLEKLGKSNDEVASMWNQFLDDTDKAIEQQSDGSYYMVDRSAKSGMELGQKVDLTKNDDVIAAIAAAKGIKDSDLIRFKQNSKLPILNK